MSDETNRLITDQMVQVAERALAWNECKDNLPNGKCECPSDAEIRRILTTAAPLIAGRALREAADDWQTGEWANVPRQANRVADRLGAAQHVSDWLRAEAGRIERSRA